MPNSNAAPQNSLKSSPQLSIVIPVYNEAGNLPQLIKELGEVLLSLDMAGEVLFVDDGSTDATEERLHTIITAERLRRTQQPGLMGHVRKLQHEFEDSAS